MIVIPSKTAQPHFLFHWPTDRYIPRFLPNDLERAQLCANAMKSRLKFHFPLLSWMSMHSFEQFFEDFPVTEKNQHFHRSSRYISASIAHIYMQKYLQSNVKKEKENKQKKHRLHNFHWWQEKIHFDYGQKKYSECTGRKQNFTWLFSSIVLSRRVVATGSLQ